MHRHTGFGYHWDQSNKWKDRSNTRELFELYMARPFLWSSARLRCPTVGNCWRMLKWCTKEISKSMDSLAHCSVFNLQSGKKHVFLLLEVDIPGQSASRKTNSMEIPWWALLELDVWYGLCFRFGSQRSKISWNDFQCSYFIPSHLSHPFEIAADRWFWQTWSSHVWTLTCVLPEWRRQPGHSWHVKVAWQMSNRWSHIILLP